MGLAASAGPLVQWGWISSQEGLVLSLLLQHVELTAIAVAVGLLISLPLGVLAWRLRALRATLFGFAGVLYVVPSIALLSLVAPLTGYFSVTTAEVALVSYTLLILMRNTVAGLESVPQDVSESALAMGYSPLQVFWRVQFPLALPSVLAGARIATVTVVGLVNVTALLGQGGLGQLVVQGFTEDFNTPVVVGLVLSVLLAGVADGLLVLVERASTPWSRMASRGAR
ncbi:MAG: ABC transporter permease [Acidimicrobiales bacterium]